MDIDGVKNELLAFNPSKIGQNQRGTAWTTEVKEGKEGKGQETSEGLEMRKTNGNCLIKRKLSEGKNTVFVKYRI